MLGDALLTISLVSEGRYAATTVAIAALLKETFGLKKEVLLDCSHRALQA